MTTAIERKPKSKAEPAPDKLDALVQERAEIDALIRELRPPVAAPVQYDIAAIDKELERLHKLHAEQMIEKENSLESRMARTLSEIRTLEHKREAAAKWFIDHRQSRDANIKAILERRYPGLAAKVAELESEEQRLTQKFHGQSRYNREENEMVWQQLCKVRTQLKSVLEGAN